ncbi:GtrA family protein [Cohnella terricola]|uniref:GtrA family protein n=1 Tax=Cohnella terricola TaxID=1289167 RepID=A0A559JB17_9BACL|nr:GtrA family protein [Cohnella terricola]
MWLNRQKAKLDKQPIKFIVVGFSNTMLSYLLFVICVEIFNLSHSWSLGISYLVGIVNSYYWNRKWTFRLQNYSGMAPFLKFISVYFLTYLVNLAVLEILMSANLWNSLINQAVALTVTTMMSYTGHKYWSFKSQTEVSK